jgi:hypothetical protein
VIKCPNAANPKICENAKAIIDRIRKKCKKDNLDHKKKKNLATANFEDFDDESKKRIRDQVLQSIAISSGNDTSPTSTITGTGNAFTPGLDQGRGRGGGPVVFMYNVSILTTQTSPMRPILPFGIQSLLPHLSLQLKTTSDDPDAPMIRCMVDTDTAFNTGNHSFYAAIAKPTCTALPKSSSPRTIHQSFFRV